MGSRVQKIAFLIFALMFVAIMAVLNTTVLTMGTSANSQLTTTVSSDDSALSIYDQGNVYGTSVITAAKDPDKVASTEMSIHVITRADTAGTTYTAAPDDQYTGSDEAKVINKNSKFDSYLCNNENGVTTGILFVQQSADASGAEALVGDGITIQGFNANT